MLIESKAVLIEIEGEKGFTYCTLIAQSSLFFIIVDIKTYGE